MRKFLKFIILPLALLLLAGCKDDVDTIPTDSKHEVYIGSLSISPTDDYLLYGLDELKILSLNNSLIEYNEMNVIFNQLAASGGKNAVWEKQTWLGKSLQQHYDEGEDFTETENRGVTAKYRIRSQAWTHIILQEQSAKPQTNPEGFLESVKLWIDYVREYCPNPEARIIVMLNWPLNTSSNYSRDMETLYENYKAVAKETGVLIFPVGQAYNLIQEEEGTSARNALYTDDRHPSVMASYLGACVFYNCFFNESPEGLAYHPADISSSQATQMQQWANKAFRTHYNVSDYAGQVSFKYDLRSGTGAPLTAEDYPIHWTVSGGGEIDENGVFYSDGTPGEYTVTATLSVENKEATGKIRVRSYGEPQIEAAGITASASYTQDFNSIGADGEASLPTGWRIERMIGNTVQRAVGTFNGATKQTMYAGGENLASNASNGLYNFGASASATDRAVGGITTGSTEATQGINVYLHLKNEGNQTISALDIAYNIEKYRMGANAAGFTSQMHVSADGSRWTSAGESFRVSFNADASTAGYATVPGDTRAVSSKLYYSLSPGESVYLAWNFSVSSGQTSSGAQALALDDVRISAATDQATDYIEVGAAKYTQDFDGIGTGTSATLPQGWRIEKRLDAPRVVGIFAGTGNKTDYIAGVNMASNASNGTYNFGAGEAAAATDRAIGGISTGVDYGTRGINIYSKLRNTGQTVNSVSVAYDVEKYRNGNNSEGFRIQLYYSKDGRNWVEAGTSFRTYFSPDANMNGFDEVPGETRAVAGSIAVQLAQGEDLYLAWNYSVNGGTGCAGAPGLAIDNVEIGFNR